MFVLLNSLSISLTVRDKSHPFNACIHCYFVCLSIHWLNCHSTLMFISLQLSCCDWAIWLLHVHSISKLRATSNQLSLIRVVAVAVNYHHLVSAGVSVYQLRHLTHQLRQRCQLFPMLRALHRLLPHLTHSGWNLNNQSQKELSAHGKLYHDLFASTMTANQPAPALFSSKEADVPILIWTTTSISMPSADPHSIASAILSTST